MTYDLQKDLCLSPLTIADTFPYVNVILRMLELLLSATKTACNSFAMLRPEGWTNPAACVYEYCDSLLYHCLQHVPTGYNLKHRVHEFVCSVWTSGSSLLWEECILMYVCYQRTESRSNTPNTNFSLLFTFSLSNSTAEKEIQVSKLNGNATVLHQIWNRSTTQNNGVRILILSCNYSYITTTITLRRSNKTQSTLTISNYFP
jgi:hypothetical protein